MVKVEEDLDKAAGQTVEYKDAVTSPGKCSDEENERVSTSTNRVFKTQCSGQNRDGFPCRPMVSSAYGQHDYCPAQR